MEDKLRQLLDEEEEFQFTKFNEGTAWQVGGRFVVKCKRERFPVAIDTMQGYRQVFHASLRGASVDNDQWIKCKLRFVHRFGHSLLYMGQLMKSKGKTIEEGYVLPENLYPNRA